MTPPALSDVPGVLPAPAPQPAVYFLCKGDEVVYVGQTANLHKRLIDHEQSKRNMFDRVFYIPCERHSLRAVEAHWIRVLAPALNAVGLPPGETRTERRRRADAQAARLYLEVRSALEAVSGMGKNAPDGGLISDEMARRGCDTARTAAETRVTPG